MKTPARPARASAPRSAAQPCGCRFAVEPPSPAAAPAPDLDARLARSRRLGHDVSRLAPASRAAPPPAPGRLAVQPAREEDFDPYAARPKQAKEERPSGGSLRRRKILSGLGALGGAATVAAGIATFNPLLVGAGTAGLIAGGRGLWGAYSEQRTKSKQEARVGAARGKATEKVAARQAAVAARAAEARREPRASGRQRRAAGGGLGGAWAAAKTRVAAEREARKAAAEPDESAASPAEAAAPGPPEEAPPSPAAAPSPEVPSPPPPAAPAPPRSRSSSAAEQPAPPPPAVAPTPAPEPPAPRPAEEPAAASGPSDLEQQMASRRQGDLPGGRRRGNGLRRQISRAASDRRRDQARRLREQARRQRDERRAQADAGRRNAASRDGGQGDGGGSGS